MHAETALRLAGYQIDDWPEILTTLYNLGGEKSHPKPNPRPNDFGRRVGKFMQSEECRELFAAKPEAPEGQWLRHNATN